MQCTSCIVFSLCIRHSVLIHLNPPTFVKKVALEVLHMINNISWAMCYCVLVVDIL